MKSLLILQHSEGTPPGTTIEWCEAHGVKAVVHKIWQQPELPEMTEDWLGVVIGGGGMNVDQESQHPWLVKEKLFIKNLLTKKIKTLGLCLGAQLMAEVLGARVRRHDHWEVGWHRITLENHSLFPAGTQNLDAFQWHGYTFEIPIGAQKLGTSQGCDRQGFAMGAHALALQFHPESTKTWVHECIQSSQSDYPTGEFVQSPDEILAQISKQDFLQQWYWQVLKAFFQPETPA